MTTINNSSTWREHAEEIGCGAAERHLTITDVSDRTGLRQITLLGAMIRQGNPISSDVPMSALYRPRYQYNGEPRWDESQVRNYFEIRDQRVREYRDAYGHLPELTREEARERQMLTLRGIARTTGYALTTLHRWSQREGWPPVAATMRGTGPRPYRLLSWPDVRAHLLSVQREERELPITPPAEAFP